MQLLSTEPRDFADPAFMPGNRLQPADLNPVPDLSDTVGPEDV